MKKLFALLLILASTTMFGQVIVHNQPVRLKEVPLGVQSDSLVVIDGIGNLKHLPISDIQSNSGLLEVDEGNGIGYVLSGQNRTQFGNVGNLAVDLSASFTGSGSGSPTIGATGYSSLALGEDVSASDYASVGIGYDIWNKGQVSLMVGQTSVNEGYGSLTVGYGNLNAADYGVSIGRLDSISDFAQVGLGEGIKLEANALNSGQVGLGVANIPITNAALMVGIGDVNDSNPDPTTWTVSERKNGLVVMKSGEVELSDFTLDKYTGTSADSLMATTVQKVEDMIANSGGGGIGGTIADTQIAFGNGTDAIQGSAKMTYDVAADSLRLQQNVIVLADGLNGTGLGAGAIYKSGFPYLYSSAENENYPNTFLGLYAGGDPTLHGTSVSTANDGGNTGVGTYALSSMGAENTQTTALGSGALAYLTNGNWNTAVGSGAGFFMTTGFRNTAVGRASMENLTTGSDNIAIGRNAGYLQTTNDQSIMIGNLTAASATTGVVNEIVIGHEATGSGSNTMTLGNGSITSIKAGANYNAVNARDLVTKGYADATYLGGGGGGAFQESASGGYQPVNIDRTNLGETGLNSLDLAVYFGRAGSGATGSMSFAMGEDNLASGFASLAYGYNNETSGNHSHAFGTNNTVSGANGFVVGASNTVGSNYTNVFGVKNENNTSGNNFLAGTGLIGTGSDSMTVLGQTNIVPAGNLYYLIVGNGTKTGSTPTTIARDVPSDAFRVYKDGKVELADFDLSKYDGVTDGLMATTVQKVEDMIGSSSVTKLPWLPSTNTGEYAWEVDGNPFIHNYWGNSQAAANPWYSNTFIGEDSGNYTVGDGQSTGFLGGINTGVGAWTLNALTTGIQNVAIGNEALALLTNGNQNVAIGDGSMYYAVTGVSNNMAVGKNTLQRLTSGSDNVAIGRNSGIFFGAASDNMTSGDKHTLLGSDTRASANGTTNEIVIGADAIGNGSNTAVIGDASITKISAGADYNAVDAEDLVTKGYADATYLGGLAEVVDDPTPQLGGDLDANNNSIDLGSVGVSKIGNIAATSNNSHNYYYSSGIGHRMYDGAIGATNYGEVNFSYIDFVGTTISMNDTFNSTVGQFVLGLNDNLGLVGWSGGVDFDNSAVSNANLDVVTRTSTATLNTGDITRTIFCNSASAQTYTIPDTLSEEAGAHVTFINIGTGTVTIQTSGTTTINGGANTIVLGGSDSTGNESVMLIQNVASSDDWFSVGKY